MKKILITGANSFIGTSFEKYIAKWPSEYKIDTIDMIDTTWRKKSFAGYDSIFHVAGIAHQKETKENAHLYYEINRDLAVETARKATTDGVKQFIFLSSMSVYGIEEGRITYETIPAPKSNYGLSKLEAEKEIGMLNSKNFAVAILRPPMVYGNGCKGNYQTLVKLAKTVPFFPDYHNQRSMLHIDRLCEFVKKLIDNRGSGLFLPQNEEYVCTSKMVVQIAAEMGRTVKLVRCLNPAVYILKHCTAKGKKAFGNLFYEK